MKRSQITHVPAFKRRADRLRQVIGAGERKDERLGIGAEGANRAGQQKLSQHLRARAAARLAGDEDGIPCSCQPVRQALRLAGLPAPSPPSSVMKRPRASQPAEQQLAERVERARMERSDADRLRRCRAASPGSGGRRSRP